MKGFLFPIILISRSRSYRFFRGGLILLVATAGGVMICGGDEPAGTGTGSKTGLKVSKEALERLKLPGVRIKLEEWCVDVEGKVCLAEGLLEFIACSRDKEHESIIAVNAAPSHIHTALLLLGAKAGRPAHQKALNEEKTRWIPVPPSGHPVDISLVVTDKEGKQVERPIKDFIASQRELDAFYDPQSGPVPEGDDEEFPTSTFLFCGSIIQERNPEGKGKRQYLADLTGSVISLSTFGDELLCLPGIHGHGNDTLRWSVDSTHLPAVGEKVILRLRPGRKQKARSSRED